MNTTLAFLPRLLPGVFGRPPTATSAGYRLPHERFFFAGIAFSATLHVAVLFGIRPGTGVPSSTANGDEIVSPEIWRPIEAELANVEEAKVAENAEKTETPPDDTVSNEPRATIPEPFTNSIPNSLEMPNTKMTPGVAADPNRKNWVVPKGPPAGAKVNKETVWNTTELDKVPAATSRAAPRYPFEMKRLGVGGTALLRFIVDNRGNVSDVEVIRADREEFGKAAAEAMLRWKFSPGMKNGRRVNTRMEMPMTFSLEKGA